MPGIFRKGGFMSLVLALAACGGNGVPKSVTLTPGATSWTAPPNVTRVESISGKGQDGKPAVDGTWGYYYYVKVYNTQGQVTSTTGPFFVYEQYAPQNYCQGGSRQPDTCYEHNGFDNRENATLGANAAALGKTFPGGYGEPAAVQTFPGVNVTPGQSYPTSIPSGGWVTLTWYE